MRAFAFVALLTVAVGCAPTQTKPPPIVGENACHIERYESWVGKTMSSRDEGGLEGKHRSICFGCMATQEFVADRVTIQFGPGRTVASVKCG